MSSQKTTNYDLNQWLPDDSVLRTDFNADNAKIDAALSALSEQVVQKANQSALDTLITAVNQKAGQADLTALEGTVAGHTTQLAQRGNCQMTLTTYTGNGKSGEDYKNSLAFSSTPWLIIIIDQSDGTSMIAVNGQPTSWARASGAAWNNFTWSGNTVKWYSTSADSQMNSKGVVYQVVMLSKTD